MTAVCNNFAVATDPADAGEVELAQNAAVLVMSPSNKAPWQLSYNTDYSFVSIRHACPCTGSEV